MSELYHHGVQGQKWGVRHGPPYPLVYAGRAITKLPRKAAKKYADVKEAKRQKKIANRTIDPKDMTEDELNTMIARLKKENEYLKLIGQKTPEQVLKDTMTKEQQETLTQGILKDLGTSLIVPLVTGSAEYAIRRKLRAKAAEQPDPNDEAISAILKSVASQTEQADVLKKLAGSKDFGDLGKAAQRQQTLNALKGIITDPKAYAEVEKAMRTAETDSYKTNTEDLDIFMKHLTAKWNKKAK